MMMGYHYFTNGVFLLLQFIPPVTVLDHILLGEIKLISKANI